MAQIGNTSAVVRLLLVLILGGMILRFPISLPPGAGDRDMQAYWSSTYLLAHGRDFSNEIALGEVEHTLTTRTDPETLYSGLSPIGNVVLLPLTFIPFSLAVYYWLILNVVFLFISAILIWDNIDPRIWIPLVVVFSFSMTVISLIYGQINTLEVLGLALFLSFSKINKSCLAGASLVLTTVKPHLVIITLPILLVDMLRKKQWKALAGFGVTLAVCSVVLFAFYPPWMQSSLSVASSGMSTVRETPTLNGLLVLIGQTKIGKLIFPVALLVGILWWFARGHEWDRRTFIDLSVSAGLIVSPIGWSYDQIMLFFPVLSLLAWIAKGELPAQKANVIVSILIVANLATYILRTYSPTDVWFFWVPFLVLGLYWIGKAYKA